MFIDIIISNCSVKGLRVIFLLSLNLLIKIEDIILHRESTTVLRQRLNFDKSLPQYHAMLATCYNGISDSLLSLARAAPG